MLSESIRLEKQIKSLESQLKACPEGNSSALAMILDTSGTKKMAKEKFIFQKEIELLQSNLLSKNIFLS